MRLAGPQPRAIRDPVVTRVSSIQTALELSERPQIYYGPAERTALMIQTLLAMNLDDPREVKWFSRDYGSDEANAVPLRQYAEYLCVAREAISEARAAVIRGACRRPPVDPRTGGPPKLSDASEPTPYSARLPVPRTKRVFSLGGGRSRRGGHF